MNWWVKSTKKICVNYIEHFLILASAATGCISISVLASLLGIPIGLKNCTIIAVNKKKKKHVK